jgi:hypothetical protein
MGMGKHIWDVPFDTFKQFMKVRTLPPIPATHP